MIGHGSFGVVFQAQLVDTGQIVAIKKVLQDKRYKNRELQIMKGVSHPNIVGLYDHFYTDGNKVTFFAKLVIDANDVIA